jgi:hypothetical protein
MNAAQKTMVNATLFSRLFAIGFRKYRFRGTTLAAQ